MFWLSFDSSHDKHGIRVFRLPYVWWTWLSFLRWEPREYFWLKGKMWFEVFCFVTISDAHFSFSLNLKWLEWRPRKHTNYLSQDPLIWPDILRPISPKYSRAFVGKNIKSRWDLTLLLPDTLRQVGPEFLASHVRTNESFEAFLDFFAPNIAHAGTRFPTLYFPLFEMEKAHCEDFQCPILRFLPGPLKVRHLLSL